METIWDTDTRLPLPPIDTLFPIGVANVATTIYITLALLVFLYGLFNLKHHHGRIVVLLVIGGLLTVLVEPFLDVIGAAWHPEVGQNTAFENFGRKIPWWVVGVYLFFFGGLGSLNYLSFERGVTRKMVWLWFCIPVAVDIVMEEIMMSFDLYYYYGHQPLIVFLKFPLWWAPCNTMGEFLGVTTLLFLMPYLRGWKLLFIPLIFPVADAVGYGLVGLPSMIAVNTQVTPWWLMQLAGVSTFVLAGLVVHAVSLAIASDSPWRKGDTTTLKLST